MSEVDRLEIQIETSASKANRELDKLALKLEKIGNMLSGINTGTLGEMATGLGKMSESMEGLKGFKSSDFNRISKGLDKLYGSSNKLGKAEKKVESVSGALSEMSKNVPRINVDASGLSEIASRMAEFDKRIQNAGKGKTFDGNFSELQKEIASTEKSLDRLLEREEKANINGVDHDSNQYRNLQYDIAKACNYLDVLYDKYNQISSVNPLANTRFHDSSLSQEPIVGIENYEKSIRQAEAAGEAFTNDTESVEEALRRLGVTARQAGQSINTSMENMTDGFPSEMDVPLGIFDRMKQKFSEMDFSKFMSLKGGFSDLSRGIGLATGSKKYSDEYNQVAESIRKAEAELDKLYEKQDRFAALGVRDTSRQWKALQYDIENAERNLERYNRAMRNLQASGRDVVSAGRGTGIFSKLGSGVSGAINRFDKFCSTINKGFGSIGRSANKAGNSMRNGLSIGRMVGMSVLFSTVFRTISAVNQGFVEGMKNLSQYSSETNKSLSMLMSSMTRLKNSFATAFAPILNAVAPALTTLINWISKAITYVGMFFAALSGKKVFTKASSVQQDFAASLDTTKDKADKADKANKKLQRTLMGFDQIHKLDAPEKDKDKGNDSGGGLSPSDMFEEVPIDNKMLEWADKFKKALKGIWELAEPTRKSIVKLWNEGFKKLGNFTWTAIKDFWNNFLKPMGKWMLADSAGLPRFFNITNDLLNEINWSALNKSLASFFTALQKPAKFTWNALMDFYEHFLKPVAVWTMGKGIPQLIDALTDLMNKINWDGLRSSFKNLWDALAPFAINVGQGLVNFFKDFTSAAGDFINGPGIKGINGLASAIKKIKPETAQKLGYAIGILATGFLAFKGLGKVGGIITSLAKPVLSLATNIGKFGSKAIGLFGKEGTVAQLFASGGLFGEGGSIATALGSITAPVGIAIGAIALIAGAFVDLWKTSKSFRRNIKEVFKGVGKAFGDFKEAVWDETLKPLVKQVKEAFKDFYKAYEDSGLKKLVETVMVGAFKILGKTIELALKALGEFVKFVGSKISDIIQTFQGLMKVIGGVGELIQGIFTLDGDKILEGFKGIGEGIVEIFSGIMDFFNPSDLIDKIYEAIGKIKPIKAGVTLFRKGWKSLKSFVGEIGAKGFSLAKKKWNTVSEFVGNIGTKAFRLGRSGWTTISYFVGNIGTKLFKLGKSGWSTVSNFVGSIGTKAFSLGRKGWKTLSGFINEFGSGLNIEAKVKLLKKWTGSVASVLGLDKLFHLAIKLPRIGINWGSSKIAGFKISYPVGFYTKYAKGGFPNTGQMFVANEAGPEMVGKMGRRNVVANNMQITNGIRDAVVEGMMEVMMNSNQSSNDKQVIIENTIMVDSETAYRMVKKGELKADRRYHVLATI